MGRRMEDDERDAEALRRWAEASARAAAAMRVNAAAWAKLQTVTELLLIELREQMPVEDNSASAALAAEAVKSASRQ